MSNDGSSDTTPDSDLSDRFRRVYVDGAVGLINDLYTHNATLHTPATTLQTRDEILHDALALLSAFPHPKIQIEETIIDGDILSMRLLWMGAHDGYGIHGPPTGRMAVWRTLSLAMVEGQRIVESWRIRDEAGMGLQLGRDIRQLNGQSADNRVEDGWSRPPLGAPEPGVGQAAPALFVPGTEWGDLENRIRGFYHDLWNRRRLDLAEAHLDPDFRFHGPTLRILNGAQAYRAYLLGFLGIFPNLEMDVEKVLIGNEGAGSGTAAVSWRIHAHHLGYGIYGTPTGRRVQVMGISHHRFEGGLLKAEWTLYDELDLLRQIQG